MPVETNVTAPIEEVWRAYTTPERLAEKEVSDFSRM
jgi:uncharacterized protein YndB with AHSA1/START domain